MPDILMNLSKYLFLILIVFIASTSDAQTNSKWLVPEEAGRLKNPIEASPVAMQDAHKLYVSLCTPCHGDKGRGDGPVAGVLNPKPADHSSAEIQSETDGSLYWKLTNGRGSMPYFGAKLTDVQRWSLIHYIRTFKQ
jgi:mono/diheme cytochrome c family protein